jgi:hypothetical protein
MTTDNFGTELVIGDLVAAVETGQSPSMEIGIIVAFGKKQHSCKVKHLKRGYKRTSLRGTNKLMKVPYTALPDSIKDDLSLEEYLAMIKLIKEAEDAQ